MKRESIIPSYHVTIKCCYPNHAQWNIDSLVFIVYISKFFSLRH